MIVDSSALIAVLFDEPESGRLITALEQATWVGVGAPTLAETAIVLGTRHGFERTPLLDAILRQFDINLVAFDERHWREAVSAYRRFGRSRDRAGLNLGDCFSYASARVQRLPLLCVGDDFAKTDLALVR